MSNEQERLDDLLARFASEHRELDEQLRSAPATVTPRVSPDRRVVVTTGTATQRSGLAHLGTGTARSS